MNFMDYLIKRESCRDYKDQPVSREQLVNIVEAGRLSPSGCNAQPWKFIVVDEAEALEKVRDALVVKGGSSGCAWRASVPAFIVLVEEPAKLMPAAQEYYGDSQRFAQGDLGMAAMNMCYAALDQGLSTCVLGMNDQKKMEQALGIPEGHEVRLVIAVGYADVDAAPRKKVRKSLEEVCGFNHW
ncbi:MAG: nitroreductase family protein [Lachnospiraceae bacterium]|nr:nitroreductase family protein [Lachnospiraceae bacterium]